MIFKYLDPTQVEQALSSYVIERLGIKLSLEYYDYSQTKGIVGISYLDKRLPNIFLITQPMDYRLLMAEGSMLALRDLVETDGRDLKEAVGTLALSANANSAGEYYVIPCIHSRVWAVGFEYRTRYAEAYALDISSVHSLQDLTPILEQLSECAPNVIPLIHAAISCWDPLGDSLGVLMNYGQSEEIVNLYETEEYADACRLLGAWRSAGYMVDEDYYSPEVNAFVALPETFGKLADYNPSMAYMDEIEAQEDISIIALSDGYVLSNAYDTNLWAISAETPYPQEAMQVLNLMYTDPYVINLLAYGIEQENYVLTDAAVGKIDFPQGIDRSNSTYVQVRNYLIGNQFLSYHWSNCPDDIWAQVKAHNDGAALSKGYGFSFDNSAVAEEVRRCSELVQRYALLLQYGVEDSDLLFKEFNDALRSAGIDRIIAEKQRQFDAWRGAEIRDSQAMHAFLSKADSGLDSWPDDAVCTERLVSLPRAILGASGTGDRGLPNGASGLGSRDR